MKEQLHYSNAPITEAVISIHIARSDEVSQNELEEVNTAIGYPNKQSRIEQKVSVQRSSEVFNTSNTEKFLGYFFLNEDKKNVYQSCKDLFAFSRLKPYESWEPFQEEARKIWDEYRDKIKPDFITRTAVRFINRVEIPLPCPDISDYFNYYPEAPKSIDRMFRIFVKSESVLEDIESIASVTLAMLKPEEDEDKVPFVFDIEVYKETNVPQSEKEIWELFNQFRHKKNQIFVESFKESYLQEFK